MWRGWHFLPGGPIDTEPSMDAATTLDNSTGSAFRSPNVLVRPYFTGRPDPDQMANKCAEPPCAGHRIQLANEMNLGDEGFGGGPDDYAAWFIAVADRVPAGTRLYYGAPSPGVPGWEQYYRTPLAQQALARASGIVVHAYGTKDQMLQVVETVNDARPDKPLWIGECNFGAGQQADINAWAHDHLRPFLDACAGMPSVEAVCYFAYWWDQSEHLPTSVNGVGTEVENVLHSWVSPPPFEPTAPEPAREPTVSEAPRDEYLTVPQFGGPLEGMGFSHSWVISACGPIAAAGMAKALGIDASITDILNSAPGVGWTPEGGMNGLGNEETLLKLWGMTPTRVDPGDVPNQLNAGHPVIISTSHHYYLAQRMSRTDDDLLVGNTGQARRGGGPWMSLDTISNLDGGINGLLTAERADAPVQPPSPPPAPTIDPLDDAFNNLWDLTLQTEPQTEERRASAQAAIDVLKDALGKQGA
jgi:hypothetical protein